MESSRCSPSNASLSIEMMRTVGVGFATGHNTQRLTSLQKLGSAPSLRLAMTISKLFSVAASYSLIPDLLRSCSVTPDMSP